jgi:AcrR family transcriptional regulator
VHSTRRARKKRWTREAIEEAGLALFERQGFRETTVSEIAEAADVAASTFFLHFPTKDDLVFAGHRAEAEALIAYLGAPKRQTLDALRDYFDAAATRNRLAAGLWMRRAAIINATPALSQQEGSRWAELVQPVLTASYAEDMNEAPRSADARLLAAMTIAGMVELGRIESEGGDAHAARVRPLEQLTLLYEAGATR